MFHFAQIGELTKEKASAEKQIIDLQSQVSEITEKLEVQVCAYFDKML